MDGGVWSTFLPGVAFRHVICGFYSFSLPVRSPSKIQKLPPAPPVWGFPGVWKLPLLRLPSQDGSPSLALLSLFLSFIFCPTSFRRQWGCFSGRLMFSASDQKLFCEVCSAFNCSFDEFVGEKVVSLSYSSAIWLPQKSLQYSKVISLQLIKINEKKKKKTLAPQKKSFDQPRQHIKQQRHYFANKGPSSQSCGFSSSHVFMWELDYKESWAPMNWCLWTVVLEKILQSPLDCKEIQPVHPKEISPEYSLEGLMLKLKPQYLGHLMQRTHHLKRCWEKLKAGGEGDDRGWDGWMASLTQWTWVWVNSGSW